MTHRHVLPHRLRQAHHSRPPALLSFNPATELHEEHMLSKIDQRMSGPPDDVVLRQIKRLLALL